LAADAPDHRTAFSLRYLDGICALCDLAFARSLPLWRVSPRDWYHELSLLADKRTKALCQNAGLPAFRCTRLGARRGEGSPGSLSRSGGHFRRRRMYRDDSGDEHDLTHARFVFASNPPVIEARISLRAAHAAFRQDRIAAPRKSIVSYTRNWPSRGRVAYSLPHFRTFHRLIMLIRLFFASICMYNPARLDFI
jgi:hypothetical protein